MSRFRMLLLLVAGLLVVFTLASCGGDDSGDAGDDGTSAGQALDPEANPETILDQTFSSDSEITSADIDVSFDFQVSGEAASDFNATLNGPIDSSGEGLPSFDLAAAITSDSESQSVDIDVGATSTGDAAYVNYGDTDYELDEETFGYLEGAFAASEQSDDQTDASATPNGLPQIREFLTDVSTEGTEDVEGVETVHVSGAVDVDALVETIRPLAESAGALGAAGQLPTPEELNQLSRLVTDATFDVYTGTEDSLLRRLEISLSLDQVQGDGTADLLIDLTLGGVNESQEIEAPSNPEPFSALTSQLGLGDIGALGGLGGLGGLGTPAPDQSGGTSQPAPGGGGAATTPAPGATPSPEKAEEYLTCIAEVTDAAGLERCQALLN